MPIQFVIFLFTAPFDKKRRLLHYNASLFSSIILGISPIWKIRIEGKEHLDRRQAHVVVMNHQSMLDIPLAFRLFYPVKMIGKKMLALVPAVGWTLFLNGHIFVNRSTTKSQFQAIRRMEALLTAGDSLLVYPEGTRTRDGAIGDFKKGAFRSASATGTPVLPVVIDGAYQVLPRGSITCRRRGTITLKVLPPIPVEKGEKLSGLAEKTRNVMVAGIEDIRNGGRG